MGAPTLGIIGAGQLAQMALAPAAALGINLQILAGNSRDSAAVFFASTVGDYKDLEQLIDFASKCECHHLRA